MDGNRIAQIIYLTLLLAAVGGWMMVEYRQRMGQALRIAVAWGLIFIGIAAGFGLWSDLRTDLPSRQMATESGTIEVPRSRDGHYYITLQVNGTDVEFLADTGASNVVLSQSDAKKLGLDPESLTYLGEAMTANGIVRTARVRLPEVTLGPFEDTQVPAYVTQGEMDMSLLGMDYLGQFRISIDAGTMVLSR